MTDYIQVSPNLVSNHDSCYFSVVSYSNKTVFKSCGKKPHQLSCYNNIQHSHVKGFYHIDHIITAKKLTSALSGLNTSSPINSSSSFFSVNKIHNILGYLGSFPYPKRIHQNVDF